MPASGAPKGKEAEASPAASTSSSPSSATATATAAAAAKPRLPYRRPWPAYVPTVIAFVLLHYLALCTEVNEAGDGLVPSLYVSAVLENYEAGLLRDYNNGIDVRNATMPFDPVVFFEQSIMGPLYTLGCKLFGSMDGIRMVLVGAWIIHLFELGVCVRICTECRAGPFTFLRYCFCTASSGFAQLMPLMKARDEYVAKYGTKTDEAKVKKQN